MADDGSAVGIETYWFDNEDKMTLPLVNLINGRIGPEGGGQQTVQGTGLLER